MSSPWSVGRGECEYPVIQALLVTVVLLMGIVAIFLLVTFFGVAQYDFQGMKKVGSLQLSVSLSTALVLFFPFPHGWLFALIFIVLYSPSFKFRLEWINNYWFGRRRSA